MNLNEIENKIVEQYNYLLDTETTWDKLKDMTFSDADLDSLDNIEGLLWAEDEFDIFILNSEASNCTTFNNLTLLIAQKTMPSSEHPLLDGRQAQQRLLTRTQPPLQRLAPHTERASLGSFSLL